MVNDPIDYGGTRDMNTRAYNYGKDKFYAYLNDQLVAVIPLKTEVSNSVNRCTFKTPTGEVRLYDYQKLFSSPQHYAQCLAGDAEPLSFSEISIENLWKSAGYEPHYDGNFNGVCFYYNAGSRIGDSYALGWRVEIDETGVTLFPGFREPKFKSKEDVLAHFVKTMEVVDFDGTTTGLGMKRDIEEKTIDIKLKIFEEK